MAALSFGSYSEAREHLKDVLDAAADGRPVIVRRDRTAAAVVDAGRLREILVRLCRGAEVVGEADGWSVFIHGVPVAADGATLDDAVDQMVDALREYAEDWDDHLRHAPNHRDNWPLVQLVGLSDDAQLRQWLVGEAA
jgi:predicted RNase H-like HicB family nuclease